MRLGERFALKVSKDHTLSKLAGVSYRIPSWAHGFIRYGNTDINRAEWDVYRRYFSNPPDELSNSFVRVRRHVRVKRGSVLVSETVKDFDGNYSRTLTDYGKVNNPLFWKRFDEVANWIVRNRIPLTDWNSNNFVVKRVSATELIPVLIDYKSAALGFSLSQMVHRATHKLPFFGKFRIMRKYAALKQNFS